jgi:hypothetical protein
VIVRPDATHVARALGPIATKERADRVVERIVAWEEREEANDRYGLTWLPQAVELESVAAFMRELDASSTGREE